MSDKPIFHVYHDPDKFSRRELYWFSENWKFAFEALAWFVRPARSLVTL